MKRQFLPMCAQIPAGRYALLFVKSQNEKIPASLWFGEADSDTRVYNSTGPWETPGFPKEWETHVHLMLLTNDEAACLLATATLLDLRGNTWLTYLKDFVNTLTDEEEII